MVFLRQFQVMFAVPKPDRGTREGLGGLGFGVERELRIMHCWRFPVTAKPFKGPTYSAHLSLYGFDFLRFDVVCWIKVEYVASVRLPSR